MKEEEIKEFFKEDYDHVSAIEKIAKRFLNAKILQMEKPSEEIQKTYEHYTGSVEAKLPSGTGTWMPYAEALGVASHHKFPEEVQYSSDLTSNPSIDIGDLYEDSEITVKAPYSPYNSPTLSPAEENHITIDLEKLALELTDNEILYKFGEDGKSKLSEDEYDEIYDRNYDLIFKHEVK